MAIEVALATINTILLEWPAHTIKQTHSIVARIVLCAQEGPRHSSYVTCCICPSIPPPVLDYTHGTYFHARTMQHMLPLLYTDEVFHVFPSVHTYSVLCVHGYCVSSMIHSFCYELYLCSISAIHVHIHVACTYKSALYADSKDAHIHTYLVLYYILFLKVTELALSALLYTTMPRSSFEVAYMHMYMYKYTYMYVHVRTCVDIHVHVHVHVHACSNALPWIYIATATWIFMR